MYALSDFQVITVLPQQLAVSNELPGRVSASMTAEIRPQVTGIIQERLFQEGSFVEKGRQLYQIDSARYEADYQRAKANLENAHAELENAQVLRKRYLRLIQVNGVSRQKLDDATARVKQANAAVSLAKADVKTAKINLDYTKVYSPISGYIGPSAVTRGALVTAAQETALAIVRQLDPVYVDLSQPVAQSRQLQKSLLTSRLNAGISEKFEVTLFLETTGDIYPYKGNLEATDLAVDERTGAIRLRSVLANPDGLLLPGMFVRATIEQTDRPPSIIIPQKSVSIQSDGTQTVWVVESGNTATKRRVKTGPSYKNNWVIIDGLQSGDKVIVEGAMMLREGMNVAPQQVDSHPVQGKQTPLKQSSQTEFQKHLSLQEKG
ncbi:efflux RND transporter periplasmic adaptor subunit [uncultured Desulfobacter sp.]|uniref:efflux RND transporter periplasmic adaptor subunit n=1 Tax=uncultured Desulfobacter sp. TaxID=240139 RepID=UPI0029F521C4|nr:efflux RND transporter periplasmic adaptor subunit [uncultured Desulfobacter sp.]